MKYNFVILKLAHYDIMPDRDQLERAANILRAGGLVAFPTETVYGLGADAANPEAVKKIFAAKGRPADHPLIVHLPSVDKLTDWAVDIPALAFQLAEAFWPGPLTLILRRHPRVSDMVTGGQDTIGLRVPGHPVALELLQTFGGGLAAPSANRFGRISPTTAAHVRQELGESVDLILDGGACEVGLESTILDLSGDMPRLLRPGAISPQQLAVILGQAPLIGGADAPRVSGSLKSHYAPRTLTVLTDNLETYLQGRAEKHLAVLARSPRPETAGDMLWLNLPGEARAYGQRLYAALRDLDAANVDEIVIEQVPDHPDWLAVRDRLSRAAKSD